jgi:hypothetical protein
MSIHSTIGQTLQIHYVNVHNEHQISQFAAVFFFLSFFTPNELGVTQKKEKLSTLLSLPIGCIKFLFPKWVCRHFQPGEIPPL